MGNIESHFLYSHKYKIDEDILRYKISIHKLVNNDKKILYHEEHLEKNLENDLHIITNITDIDKNIMAITYKFNKLA